MKTLHLLTTALLATLSLSRVGAQSFDPGSNGSYGALNVTSNLTLDLPTNGIFNCTSIMVSNGVTLTFRRNALNTAVYLLATEDVAISGTIDVSGEDGRSLVEGFGGPGGFDGGKPGFAESPPGAGYGPGAGKGGANGNVQSGAGSGSYAAADPACVVTNKGAIYGSPLLVPLVGGSGGGGTVGSPGFGGGAILIASKTSIRFTAGSVVRATGGMGAGQSACNSGSGGAIRLVAPAISGEGTLDVRSRSNGGSGRIRVDTLNRRDFRLAFAPNSSASMGSMMLVFPTPLPRLDIVEAAGTQIPEGTGAPVYVQLPFGSNTNQTVRVQARNFNKVIPVKLVLTPDSGDPVVYDLNIDNRASNPAVVNFAVTLPVNQRVTVNAWKR